MTQPLRERIEDLAYRLSVPVSAVFLIIILVAAIPNPKELDPVLDRLYADEITSVELVRLRDGGNCVTMSFLDGSSKTLCDRYPAG